MSEKCYGNWFDVQFITHKEPMDAYAYAKEQYKYAEATGNNQAMNYWFVVMRSAYKSMTKDEKALVTKPRLVITLVDV